MTLTSIRLSKYGVQHINDGEPTHKAIIYVYDEAGDLAATLFFEPVVSDQSPYKKGKQVIMYYEIGRISEILSTIRYEKILMLQYDLDVIDNFQKVSNVRITASAKDVGEQEGV
jgi:hypothetical protein